MTDIETVADRIARLGLTEPSERRLESLAIAHPLVDDAAFARLAQAERLSRRATIVLPANRLEHLSRGRGWCRSFGRGETIWGERVADGYRVGSGRWSVGATDGFARKRATEYHVIAVTVGDAVWTII